MSFASVDKSGRTASKPLRIGIAFVALFAASGCSSATDGDAETTASSQAELALCRTIALVATKKYTAPASTTDATGTVAAGMGLKIPSTLTVTAGTTGTGSATFTFRRLGSSTDVACTYKVSTTKAYGFSNCTDGTAVNAVVTATKVVVHIVNGNTTDSAGKTEVTFDWTEATNCTTDAGVDASVDAAKDADADAAHDADAAADAHDADANADVHDAGADVDAAHDGAADAADAAHDATVDASADAAHDAVADAPHDAATDADAAHDAGADAAPTCTPANCNDGNACTTDTCVSNVCTHGAVATDDSNACTTDACDPVKGVTHVAVAIDDGNACTTDACNPSTGVSHTAVAIDDSNACTTDACSPTTGVSHTPVAVDDSNACTTDSCNPSTGVSHVAVSINDSNACTTDACDPSTGVSHTAIVIDDGNVCTTDACSPSTGVAHVAVALGTACGDNSNRCIGAFTCNASAACVQATSPIVDDGNACTQDSCDPATGVAHLTIPGCGPTTDRWTSVVGRPGPRDGASAAFDTTSNTLVLFGGENAGASLGDTWTLDRATGRWSVTYASGPDARAASAVAFDSVRHRVVVFGGVSRAATGDTFLADTWEYDPSARTWSVRANASPPPARAYATALFDAVRKRVVVFGGRGAGGAADNGDLWEWDGATWTRRVATGTPLARSAASSVYDVARNRYVLFGGESVLGPSIGVALDDTWELDPSTATWTSVTPSQRPPARLGHAMIFDAARAKVVAFGGTSAAQIQLADTWEYDGAAQTWSNRAPASSPSARAGHAFVYDATTSHALLVSGVAYSSTGQHTPDLDDMWELDGASGAWTPRTADGAPALYRGGTAYDPIRKSLIVRGDEARPAMWELTAGRWASKDMLAGMTGDYGAAFANGLQGRVGGQERSELARSGLVFDSARGRTLYFAAGNAGGADPHGGTVAPQPPSLWSGTARDGLRARAAAARSIWSARRSRSMDRALASS